MTPLNVPHGVKVSGPTPDFECEFWWRADDRRYANYDPFAEFDQPAGSHLQIKLTRYRVVRHTPKGVVLRTVLGDEFFQIGNAIRQKAVPTISIALQDLVRRKERHVKGCEDRLTQAKEHLAAASRALGAALDMEASK